MKLKYIGLTPATNIFGDWQPGEIKNVPDGTVLPGFKDVDILEDKIGKKPLMQSKKWGQRKVREDLRDKMERDSQETRD
jgi:hypothetical protein